MEKQKYLDAIHELKNAWLKFCSETNERAYRDKNDLEQDTEEIGNALNTTLDKLSLHLDGKYDIPGRSTKEQLASKLSQASQSLRQGNVRVDDDTADNFIKAIDLLDSAREAKEKGKTAAIKDKYKRI